MAAAAAAAAAQKGTVICTGANGGLGTAFVKAFAASPEGSQYQGIYTVRNPATAHDLHAALKSAPKTHHSEILALNLASLQNIRAVASDINTRVSQGHLPPIRTLVLNAAFQDANAKTLKPQAFTEDGFEMTFGVNYLANFFLVLLLLRSMDKENGRIVLVSSWMHDPYSPHNSSPVIFKEEKYKVMFPGTAEELAKGIVYDDNGYYAGMRRYGASKAALVMFMYELQRRLTLHPSLSRISILALDPGAMGNTSLTKRSPWFIRLLTGWLMWAFQGLAVRISPNGALRPAWKSAEDLLQACFGGGYSGEKAVYLDGSVRGVSSVEARDGEKQRVLWEGSGRLVGLGVGETVLKDF